MRNNTEDAKVFKALCDERRLGILELLRKGERCACKLLEDMDICQSSLSYHMKILVESGIVTGRQEGKWIHYSISLEGRDYAMELLRALTTVNETESEANCCNSISA